METGPVKGEGGEGWCRSASCPTIHSNYRTVFSPWRPFLQRGEQASSPAFHVFSQPAAAPTAGAKKTYTSIVPQYGVAVFGPGQLQRLEVGDIGGSTASGVASSLVTQRIAAPELSLVHSTVLCCIVPTGKVRLRRGSPRCRFVCWSEESLGRCYLGLTATRTV